MKRTLISPRAWLLSLLAGARKPAPSAGPRRPDARTGRARRLSLLAVLALLLSALSLFAPAPADAQTTLLSTTLTAGHSASSPGNFGCHENTAVSDLGACSARLTTNSLTHEGTTHTVRALQINANGATLLMSPDITENAGQRLTLYLDGKSFPFAAAIYAGQWFWSEGLPSLTTDGQKVQVRVTLDDPPAAPTNMGVTPGSGQLSLTWTAPPSAVTGYDVHYTSVLDRGLVPDTWPLFDNPPGFQYPSAGWVAVSRTGATASQTISGLTSGTDYRMRVRAKNRGGVSDWVFGTGTTSGTAPPPVTAFVPPPGSQTLLTATLTVDVGGSENGCNDNVAAIANCSVALSTTSFSFEGTSNSVTAINSVPIPGFGGSTQVVLSSAFTSRILRRLTLHLDGESFPFADANLAGGNLNISWNSAISVAWTKGQRVQVHLTYKLPTVSLSASPIPVQEGSPVTVTATLSEALSEDVRIPVYSVMAGTFDIDIPAGQTTGTHELTAPQLDDGEMKQYQIAVEWWRIREPRPLDSKGSQSTARVQVLDENADPPRVSVSDAKGWEQLNNYGRLCFDFTLDRAVSHEVWVNYWTEDGTAKAGQDYTGKTSLTLGFAPGETRKNKCISIIDDGVEDSGETFYVVLGNPPQGAILGRDRGTGTIYNHEPTSLSALTAEGAPGEDGPFTALDIGSFAPATTAYAATVPHGTTHVRLTPKSLNGYLTITTGLDGKGESQVSSGQTGPAVALAVGENVLVVKTQFNGQRQTYRVTITREESQAPTVASAISDTTITNESGTSRVSLSGVFTDADGDDLTVTAVSSSTSVATVSVSADYSSLTVTAKSRGTTTVTVTASDGNGGSVEDSFTVTVKAAPVVASAISDISELASGASQQISLSGVFSDADGDALTLSAVSSNNAVATVVAQLDPVTASATAITVTGVAEGTATVTVTARDTDGNSVSDAFDVTVPAVEEQKQVAEVPGPVVSLAVTASAEDSVTVSWSAPETGGAPQGYIVHIKRKGGGYQDTLRPGADRTQVSFSSLDPGRTYDVWVRAQNGTGKGERVSASITLPESEDTPPAVLPGPVTGLELMADGNALTVSWSAPETGGAPDGYIVHVSADDGGKGKTKTPKAMKTQVTFKNLEAGRTYGVWVRAQNEAGKGNRVHASITMPKPQPTATPTPTATPVPTATATPTATPVPTATSTPVPTATSTPVPTATSTPVPTATATATPIPTATATAAPVPTATATAAPVPTATSTPAPTATATPASQSSDIVAQYDSNGNGVIDGAECDRVIADYQAWIINTQELLELRKVWACN